MKLEKTSNKQWVVSTAFVLQASSCSTVCWIYFKTFPSKKSKHTSTNHFSYALLSQTIYVYLPNIYGKSNPNVSKYTMDGMMISMVWVLIPLAGKTVYHKPFERRNCPFPLSFPKDPEGHLLPVDQHHCKGCIAKPGLVTTLSPLECRHTYWILAATSSSCSAKKWLLAWRIWTFGLLQLQLAEINIRYVYVSMCFCLNVRAIRGKKNK